MSNENSPPGTPPFWMVYFNVEDTDATVAKAQESSAAPVIAPAMDAEGVGRIAVLADPQGAAFSVITPAPVGLRQRKGRRLAAPPSAALERCPAFLLQTRAYIVRTLTARGPLSLSSDSSLNLRAVGEGASALDLVSDERTGRGRVHRE